jgi:hypothetical protein
MRKAPGLWWDRSSQGVMIPQIYHHSMVNYTPIQGCANTQAYALAHTHVHRVLELGIYHNVGWSTSPSSTVYIGPHARKHRHADTYTQKNVKYTEYDHDWLRTELRTVWIGKSLALPLLDWGLGIQQQAIWAWSHSYGSALCHAGGHCICTFSTWPLSFPYSISSSEPYWCK